MNNLFSTRNIGIAIAVVLVALVAYYTLKPSKAPAPAAKPVISAPVTPAAPAKK